MTYFLLGVIFGIIVDGLWWQNELTKLLNVYESGGIEALEAYISKE